MSTTYKILGILLIITALFLGGCIVTLCRGSSDSLFSESLTINNTTTYYIIIIPLVIPVVVVFAHQIWMGSQIFRFNK